MRNRLKEEEIIERNIRNLLKLPENRRCINCNSLGPQYVCTTFLTFVCTNCSGVHREFTHRVKSVSMAKFTAEEVSALQAAGNEKARQIYLKEWDPVRQSHPDSSNLQKIREFIKQVYENRKYTGERNDSNNGERNDKPPRVRLGEKDLFNDSRKVTAYLGDIRSPHYESKYEKSGSGRSSRSYYDDGRSPSRYNYEEGRSPSRFNHDEGRSPSRFNHDEGRSPSRFNHDEGRNPSRYSHDEGRSPSRYSHDERNSSSRYSHDERKNPRNSKDNTRYLGPRKGPARFEVVDDRFRDDGNGLGNRSISLSIVNKENMSRSRSPENPMRRNSIISMGTSPLGDILGETTSPLDEGRIAKETSKKKADNAANKQNTPRSGSQRSIDERPSEEKKGSVEKEKKTLQSLIDFDSYKSDHDTTTAENKQKNPVNTGANQSTHEPSAHDKTLVGPKPNTLEYLLFELSSPVYGSNSDAYSYLSENNMPAATPSSASASDNNAPTNAVTTNMPVQHSGATVSPVARLEQTQAFPCFFDDAITASTSFFHDQSSGANMDMSGVSTTDPWGQTAEDNISSTPRQTSTPVADQHNQSWELALVPSSQDTSSASAEYTSQNITTRDTSSGVGSIPHPGKTEFTGRMELPEDLFASSYIPSLSFAPWQSGPPQAMAYNMQYYPPNTMLAPAYTNPTRSTNPFDVGSDTAPAEEPQFPSMTSLQAELPGAGLQHVSSYDSHSRGLMASQPIPFSSATSPSPFMGQQVQYMTHSSLQGNGSFESNGSFFGSTNTPLQLTSGFPTTANPYTPTGGNPFG